MKVAVFSDVHDRLDHLQAALRLAGNCGAERLLFLGDFCAPFTLAEMAGGFPGPIDAVFGNNDGDPFLLCRVAAQRAGVTLHGPYAELEIGGRKIALQHYPEIARRLAECGAFDAVFSGHDHRFYAHRIGETLWANPGEIMGRFGQPGFGVYDTGDGAFEHIFLQP
jgi:hypothetical protein